MKLTEICRESIPVIEFTEPMSTLAQEAEDVLGYSRLKQERDQPKSTLLSKLAELQMEVLKRADVDAYKQERLVEQTKQKLQQWAESPSEHLTQFWGPGWRREKIADYKEPIPEFVLNKAIQIKREIPDALIFVESMQDYPDPFLIVATPHPQYACLTEEEHYVEVWEEPRFEGVIR